MSLFLYNKKLIQLLCITLAYLFNYLLVEDDTVHKIIPKFWIKISYIYIFREIDKSSFYYLCYKEKCETNENKET